jgi:hypothetical protein
MPTDPDQLEPWLVQIIVLEAHNSAAFQNACRIPTIPFEARHVFDAVVDALVGDGPLAIASPRPRWNETRPTVARGAR